MDIRGTCEGRMRRRFARSCGSVGPGTRVCFPQLHKAYSNHVTGVTTTETSRGLQRQAGKAVQLCPGSCSCSSCAGPYRNWAHSWGGGVPGTGAPVLVPWREVCMQSSPGRPTVWLETACRSHPPRENQRFLPRHASVTPGNGLPAAVCAALASWLGSR